jgi:hypothetical protein
LATPQVTFAACALLGEAVLRGQAPVRQGGGAVWPGGVNPTAGDRPRRGWSEGPATPNCGGRSALSERSSFCVQPLPRPAVEGSAAFDAVA